METTPKSEINGTDANLSDVDRLVDLNEAEFRGATLSLDQSSEFASAAAALDGKANEATNNTATDSASGSQRPVSSAHRPSTVKTMSEEDARTFFSLRDGMLEKAVETCKPVLLDHLDGNLLGYWLVTEIDHWDTEKERMVFVTEKSLILLKYDFINLRLLNYQRLPLKQFDEIIIGELKYPDKSLMPPRNQLGVQCVWNKSQPLPFMKKWNPWSHEIPWITLTSHPLEKLAENNKENYDVDKLSECLGHAIEKLDPSAPNTPESESVAAAKKCEISYRPVIIENYAGVASAVHNLNNFGFFKSHGKLSF